MLSSPSDHLSAHLIACCLISDSWQAPQITFRLSLRLEGGNGTIMGCVTECGRGLDLVCSSNEGTAVGNKSQGQYFQLTSLLAAYTQTADKPRRSPFSSPCGCAALNTRIAASQEGIPTRALQRACCQAHRITFQLTSWLAAYTQTADKPHRSPFSSPCGCAALNTCIAASQKGIPTQALQSACC